VLAVKNNQPPLADHTAQNFAVLRHFMNLLRFAPVKRKAASRFSD